MPRIDNVLSIAREPETVIAYLADGRNEVEWNRDSSDIVLLTAEPIGVGSRFRGRFRGMGEVEWELTELDPGGSVTATVTSPSLTIRARFVAAPADSGTRLTEAIELEPRGLFRVLIPVMLPMMRARFRKNHERMKQNLARAALHDPSG